MTANTAGDTPVIHISDGDTLSVQVGAQRRRVTSVGVDTPEIEQPHGVAAKRALARLTFNRWVRLDWRSGTSP
jgi:endonuclease YncB( thermonuclease family)